MRLTISSLFVLATAAVATANSGFLNPPLDSIKPIPISSPAGSAKPIVGRMTNAKRLAMKLPPLKPKALWRGTPAASAPRSNTSMLPPVPHKCNILVKTDGNTLGYLRRSWNAYGEYGTFQQDQAGSLEVTLNASPDDPSPDELDLHADNGPSTVYPYFGAVMGLASDSSDFSAGSVNYAFIGGTNQSPAGSPPQQGDTAFSTATDTPVDWESAIWKYNPTTQEITAQWINTDGSHPETYILYANNDNNKALILTGDFSALNDVFGTTYPRVTLTCVAPVSQQPVPK